MNELLFLIIIIIKFQHQATSINDLKDYWMMHLAAM